MILLTDFGRIMYLGVAKIISTRLMVCVVIGDGHRPITGMIKKLRVSSLSAHCRRSTNQSLFAAASRQPFLAMTHLQTGGADHILATQHSMA